MPEKDEFTFDDQDGFPETDLSSAFAESEQSAPESPAATKSGQGVGGSRTRVLSLVLLLVFLCAAGAYYFMGLGGTDPELPKPPPQSKQAVSLPPQPVKTAAVPAPAPPTEVQAVSLPAAPAEPAPREMMFSIYSPPQKMAGRASREGGCSGPAS